VSQKIEPSRSFFIEDLKPYGIEEGIFDEESFKILQKQGLNSFLVREPSSNIRMFKYAGDSIDNKSNFYLAAKIKSPINQDVALIIDGSNSYAAWLNGEKLVEVREKYSNVKQGDRFLNVSLKKGVNILFVKINRGTNEISWDLIAHLTTRTESKRIFSINYSRDFVLNPIVDDSFGIYTGPYTSGQVEVMDLNDSIVASCRFDDQNTNINPFTISGLSDLEEGYYKTLLKLDDYRVEETIYKGDYNKFVELSKEFVDTVKGSAAYLEDLTSAMYLVNYINFPPEDITSPSYIRFENKSKVYWGYSLFCMLQQRDNPTQIMTYNDHKGNTGDFILHIDSALKQKIPLVIVMPHKHNDTLFLTDWYARHFDQIEPDNLLADEYGFALVRAYAHGKNYTAATTKSEIDAVINRLASEYDIDNQNIFIIGDCEAGRRVFVQLTLTPDRFAACAVKAPITLTGGEDGVPINLIPAMKGTPILIKHGAYDTHVSVEHSRRFVAEAKKHQLPIEYIEPKRGHVYVCGDHNRFAFEFFRKIISNQ